MNSLNSYKSVLVKYYLYLYLTDEEIKAQRG